MVTTTARPHLDDSSPSSDVGRLILRLVLGVLILLHGVAKLKGGVDPVAGMLTGKGLPGVLAYGVYIGEVIAPILLIVGVWTRPAAALIAINMVVALLLAHLNDLGRLNETGGWAVELQMMYLWTAVAVMLVGAGRFSLARADGKLN